VTLRIGVVPKSTRNPYFEDCRRGAQEAAQELGFTLLWDGPQQVDAGAQAEIVETWTREGVPAIAVSVVSSPRLVAALKNARAAGTRVLTWDSDGPPDARDFVIVHATPASVAHALSFELARILAGKGDFAAITSTLADANQNAWIAELRSRVANEYPDLHLLEVRPCEDNVERAKQEALRLLGAHPGLQGIVGLCSPAVPGAAEALKEAHRADVRLTGVSLPAICRSYIEEGVVQSVVMWKTRNLGYLVGASAQALASGALQPGIVSFRAGRLGSVVVQKDEIRLGRCHIVTRGNLADFE